MVLLRNKIKEFLALDKIRFFFFLRLFSFSIDLAALAVCNQTLTRANGVDTFGHISVYTALQGSIANV